MKRIQRRLKKQLRGVVLFGSVARGEQNKESDIDLLVLVKRLTARGEEMVYQELVEEELQWNSHLSPIVYSWKAYQNKKALGVPFIKEVEQDGILVTA